MSDVPKYHKEADDTSCDVEKIGLDEVFIFTDIVTHDDEDAEPYSRS